MRRTTPCFVAVQDDVVASGIQPDRHGLKQILWESAENVYFAAGRVRRKKPAADAFSTGGSPIRGLGELHAANGGRWLWAGENGNIWRWEFGAPEQVDAAYGTYRAAQAGTLQPTIYDFTSYGDWMIYNDSIAPKIFNRDGLGGLEAYDYGEVPQEAVRYKKRMNFMMAFGYGLRGTRVGWSDADDIFTWTAAATNLAGSLAIDEFDTPIRAAEQLGNYDAVYAEDQMALVRYVGAPYVFGVNGLTFNGIGAIGKAAVASDTRVNVGLGRNGAWWTDGNSFKYIDEGIIKDYLQDNVNWDQGGLAVVMRNDATGCFEFHLPMGISQHPTKGFSWDPRNGGWSPVPVRSFKSERKLFGFPICGTADGIVQFDDNDNSLAGALSLSTRPMTLVMPDGIQLGTHIVSRVDELELLLKEASNIEVRVGCGDDANTDWPDWTEWMAVDVGNHIVEISGLPEMPLWRVQFRSTPGINDWRFNLQGLLLYGPSTGTKLEA